ncbi:MULTISPECIES: DUF4917 family protein [Asticcacaulis]|uniref:DUF4917 family protein n=1 Tax=Asticcacaulis TaxID=76890 RepID=UPI001AE2697A|nr:DUF4917 family protein [Asticcacaulis sp. BE141]MBP2158836.1 hypothetical protein [Asticcacaulis solisilvae]MDR6799882.1 hypothetical protein [Asticcacaulis sp. BE141]
MSIQSGPQEITFEKAIAQTDKCQRHLLLGNGFSINARKSFNYDSLFESGKPFSSEVARIFQEQGANDFELALENAQSQLHKDEINSAFLRALSKVHPHSSVNVTDDEADHCTRFLEHFVGISRRQLRGRVYTTNYDLLLYWVVVRKKRRLWCYDNHEGSGGAWQPEKIDPGLVYLHGALHLFERDNQQIKLHYPGGGRLIDQMRERLNQGEFPVIVAEGTSVAKSERIQRSAYLKKASKLLKSGLRGTECVLFTYGHSLNERDSHLFNILGESKVKAKAIYIGAWGGLDGSQRKAIDDWTSRWSAARLANGEVLPPEVWVYDTSKFSPWRERNQ